MNNNNTKVGAYTYLISKITEVAPVAFLPQHSLFHAVIYAYLFILVSPSPPPPGYTFFLVFFFFKFEVNAIIQILPLYMDFKQIRLEKLLLVFLIINKLLYTYKFRSFKFR